MHVQITAFGGIFPALKPRALPGDGAQVNHNLLASVPDFRPVATDLAVAVSGVSNPPTLYRLDRKADGSFNSDMSTGWLPNAAQVSYVKGPINNDTTERTYYTFDDGLNPPRWLDVTGIDRQLGVPKPAAAPVTVAVTAGQFTPEDRSAAIEAAIEKVVQFVRDRAARAWIGGDLPGVGTATSGYVNMQAGYGATPTQGKQARLFGFDSYNNTRIGLLTQLYGAAGSGDQYGWTMDSQIQPTWLAADATLPAFANVGAPGGSYRDNIAITFTAYGLGYTLDAAGLAADLATIEMPGLGAGSRFLTNAQINGGDGIVDRLAAELSITGNSAIAGKYTALRGFVDELRTTLNGGTTAALAAQFAAYFASSAISTFTDTELTTWANRVYDNAASVMAVTTPAYRDDLGAAGP